MKFYFYLFFLIFSSNIFSLNARDFRAPRGSEKTCKTWQAEAAMRMLMNNLDPEVAEAPDRLIVYGGKGQAARSWDALEEIISQLKKLEVDQTLLIQSGKPVGVVQTTKDSPRVIIANSNLVPHWANQPYFDELARKGLIMYGQMTAGSWIYIGTQGILQGTYETFSSCADKYFNGSLKNCLCVTGGCGGMGGAQPLAITMNEGTCLIADVDKTRLVKRKHDRYLDFIYDDPNEAINHAVEAKKIGSAVSIGWCGNIINLLEILLKRKIIPEVLTDQTSSHDLLNGYYPNQISKEEADKLRKTDPEAYIKLSNKAVFRHVELMLTLQKLGSITFDYGNNIRQMAYNAGLEKAFNFPGFVPEFIRPLFCEGKGPFRWVALSGDPNDIHVIDEAILKLFPEDFHLKKWIDLAQERVHFQGLPARICWLGVKERAKAGLLINQLVREGKVCAPIVIGRDHLDCGSVASPNRETEGMLDGSDAISDWPLLNFAVNAVSGSSWVSFHHGGGVGIGYSQHAGQVIVCDGTLEADARLSRVLMNDPLLGVFRHADAGYEKARTVASEIGIEIPMK